MTNQKNSYGSLRRILTEMRALLLKHDAAQQEAVLTVLSAIDDGDREIIKESLNSLSFWGGSGSILDLILHEVPWTAEFKRDVADDSRLTT
jgi:hypothetical protein